MKTRALSIDALRGFAIIAMILSGQMILTHLPAWMAHAQVPPNSSFNPNIFGITWVDLVFPFFLFAMGASFPFSLGTKLENGASKKSLCWDSFTRGLQLVFFALFFMHMRPFVISNPVDIVSCIISLSVFGLMFFMFSTEHFFSKETKNLKRKTQILKVIAFIIAFVLMYTIQYQGKENHNFDIYYSDIILIVLANAAFLISLIYIFTFNKPVQRILVLPFIMAVFLASSNDGWVKELYNFTPFDWVYKFYYLKYFFIVIPGTLAGEYIKERTATELNVVRQNKPRAILIAVVSLVIIVSNVCLLFARQLEVNLVITLVLLVLNYFILKPDTSSFGVFWKKLFSAGAYCLVLGLFLEAYEGGIRKDASTYSYYFVTSGLAFLAILFFSVICDYFKCIKATRFLVLTGQNPMIAYVSTSMVVMPILTILTVTHYFDVFGENAFMGFLRGFLLTAAAVAITSFFSKKKWFWRT
jgi:predicted acyltransferase